MKRFKALVILTQILCLSFTTAAFAVAGPSNLKQYKQSSSVEMSSGDWINEQWINDNGWDVRFWMNKAPGSDAYPLYYTYGWFYLKRDTGGPTYSFEGLPALAFSDLASRTIPLSFLGEGRYQWEGRVEKKTVYPFSSVEISDPVSFDGSTNFHFGIDITPPELLSIGSSTHANQDAWYNNPSPIISVEATDPNGQNGQNGSGPGGLSYDLSLNQLVPDNSSDTTAGYNWGQALYLGSRASGTWYFSVKPLDAAGNAADFNLPVSFRQIKIDTVDPRIDGVQANGLILSDRWQNTNGNPTFSIDADDDHSGVAGFKYYWGPAYLGVPDTNSSSNEIGPLTASQGVNYFRVYAYDNAADTPNQSAISTNFVFKYDSIAPETNIIWGPNGTINTSLTFFNYSGTDAGSAGLTFSYKFDGGDWMPYSNSGTAFFSKLAPGNHTFEVRAKDAAGNEDQTPDERVFTYTPPPPKTTGGAKIITLPTQNQTNLVVGSQTSTNTLNKQIKNLNKKIAGLNKKLKNYKKKLKKASAKQKKAIRKKINSLNKQLRSSKKQVAKLQKQVKKA